MNKTAGSAHDLAENPIVRDVLTSGDWHTKADDEEIGNGQVGDELVGHGLHAFVEEHEIDDENVADQAD